VHSLAALGLRQLGVLGVTQWAADGVIQSPGETRCTLHPILHSSCLPT